MPDRRGPQGQSQRWAAIHGMEPEPDRPESNRPELPIEVVETAHQPPMSQVVASNQEHLRVNPNPPENQGTRRIALQKAKARAAEYLGRPLEPEDEYLVNEILDVIQTDMKEWHRKGLKRIVGELTNGLEEIAASCSGEVETCNCTAHATLRMSLGLNTDGHHKIMTRKGRLSTEP